MPSRPAQKAAQQSTFGGGSPQGQSPAEVLELLGGPFSPKSTQDNKDACFWVPPPLAFPTGAPLAQKSLPGAAPIRFSGWSLEDIGMCPKRSEEVMSSLDTGDRSERSQTVTWLSKGAMALALTKHGSRLIQKALEVAGSSDRDELVAVLQPFVEELYDSPHGNHVLTKIVEVMPSEGIGFVVSKLAGNGPAVARHRFGCRVLERLIEHCDGLQLGGLIDEIVAESASLCRHPYGNFVVQHLIEHSPSHRETIFASMLPELPMLAAHRTASHVVQKVMEHSDHDGRQASVSAFLEADSPHTLAENACSRYGSFVVEQLAGMEEGCSEVKQSLTTSSETLSQSPFGLRVLECFGLPEASSAEVPSSLPCTSKL